MKRTVTFTIGGESVDVSEMAWDVIEDTVMPILDEAGKRAMATRMLADQLVAAGVSVEDAAKQAADASVPWWKQRAEDVRILAAALRRPYDELRQSLSMDEAREVSEKIGELLKISGFVTPGEAEAASGSTEISTDSSPDSLTMDSPALRSGTKSRGR